MLENNRVPETRMDPGERSVKMLENIDRSSANRPLREINLNADIIERSVNDQTTLQHTICYSIAALSVSRKALNCSVSFKP